MDVHVMVNSLEKIMRENLYNHSLSIFGEAIYTSDLQVTLM